MACERGHTHLIVFTHACGYYSRAATISLAELQVRLLFEGGYYSGCGFYSNKYGNKLKEDFKQMSSRIANLTPIEPVKLTDENNRFSFIITSSKGWISPPFCVPGGYKFCIKHKEGKMASLMLFKEKYYDELPMDTQYKYRLEISYTKASFPGSMRLLPTQNFDLVSLEQIQFAVDGYEKEVASITMPEGDLLSTNIIVTLAHIIGSLEYFFKHQQSQHEVQKPRLRTSPWSK